MLYEMVGLGAVGSSVLPPRTGGGSRSISTDSALLIVLMSSGRDFFLVGFGRDDDFVLFFRDVTVVIEDCGFSELA